MVSSSKASRMPKNLCALSSQKRPVRSAPSEHSVEAAFEQPPFRQERLESLLNTIKQDLNQPLRK
jgi:hypothetical protein